jgi:beta-N-acetylhexosaminidase
MPVSRAAISPASAVVLAEDFEDNFPSPGRPPSEPRASHASRPLVQPRQTPKPAPAPQKAVQIPPLPVKKPDLNAAARALGERERALHPRPPIVTASRIAPGAAPPKAEAGSPPEMALRSKVGQLFLSGFKGKRSSDPDVARIATALKSGRLSGVIVSDANVSNFRQLRQLILALTKDSGGALPIVAIEQPGGPDSALSENKGFAFYASASAVSNERDTYEAQLVYREMSAELSSLGVTLNIGPSGDICRDGGVDLSASCFGTAPARIAALAAAFNFGHHDRGVLTALRHAPFGSGLFPSWNTQRASAAMLRRLLKAEPVDALVIRMKATEHPFADFVTGGSNGLRGSHGFHGAIVYDLDLGVGGAPLHYGEAILRAFQTGADIVLVQDASALPADLASIGYDAVEAGLKSGRLSSARVEDAYRHVQRLKTRLRGLQARTRMAEIFGQ